MRPDARGGGNSGCEERGCERSGCERRGCGGGGLFGDMSGDGSYCGAYCGGAAYGGSIGGAGSNPFDVGGGTFVVGGMIGLRGEVNPFVAGGGVSSGDCAMGVGGSPFVGG